MNITKEDADNLAALIGNSRILEGYKMDGLMSLHEFVQLLLMERVLSALEELNTHMELIENHLDTLTACIDGRGQLHVAGTIQNM